MSGINTKHAELTDDEVFTAMLLAKGPFSIKASLAFLQEWARYYHEITGKEWDIWAYSKWQQWWWRQKNATRQTN